MKGCVLMLSKTVIKYDSLLNLRIEKTKRDTFVALCKTNNMESSQVLRLFIDAFIAGGAGKTQQELLNMLRKVK